MFIVSAIQPYFVPYLPYFAMLAASDRVVILDDVQFPRRGRVHRNSLADDLGRPGWLTLPLTKCAVDTRIAQLRFHPCAERLMQAQLQRFPVTRTPPAQVRFLTDSLCDFSLPPQAYILQKLDAICAMLGLPFRYQLASQLPCDGIDYQSRIIRYVKAVGGDLYLNPSAGQALYQASAFTDAGLGLRFLPDYQGPKWSMLQRLATESVPALIGETRAIIDACRNGE
jgi:hypothetical protein